MLDGGHAWTGIEGGRGMRCREDARVSEKSEGTYEGKSIGFLKRGR